MSQKLLRKDFFIPKQELLIMQARKFGEISHMITNQIFGLWDVFSMNQ